MSVLKNQALINKAALKVSFWETDKAELFQYHLKISYKTSELCTFKSHTLYMA